MFSRVPSIDSMCFLRMQGLQGIDFFLLSTDFTYTRVPGEKGGPIFFSLKIFFQRSFQVQIGVLQFVSRVQFYAKLSNFYAKLNVSNLYVTKFVLVLVQTDLIQFENSNHIRSICTKTNTNSLHTNLMHSILRNIGHVIQIVVHQFVCKTSTHKIEKTHKMWSPGG